MDHVISGYEHGWRTELEARSMVVLDYRVASYNGRHWAGSASCLEGWIDSRVPHQAREGKGPRNNECTIKKSKPKRVDMATEDSPWSQHYCLEALRAKKDHERFWRCLINDRYMLPRYIICFSPFHSATRWPYVPQNSKVAIQWFTPCTWPPQTIACLLRLAWADARVLIGCPA